MKNEQTSCWSDIELNYPPHEMAGNGINKSTQELFKQDTLAKPSYGYQWKAGKGVFLALGVCGVILLGGAVVTMIQKDSIIEKANDLIIKYQEEPDVCSTPDCAYAARTIAEKMDESVEPCQDFYQFACGRWVENTELPPGTSKYSTLKKLRDEVSEVVEDILSSDETPISPKSVNDAKRFYKSCTDLDSLETDAKEFFRIALVNNYPAITNNWNEDSFDVEYALANASRLTSMQIFMNAYVYLDSQNTSRNSLHIDQAGLGLIRDIFVEPENFEDIIDAYQVLQFDSAKLIAEMLNLNVPAQIIAKDMKDLFAFETELAKITVPSEDRRNSTEMYNPFLLKDIQTAYPKFAWSKYFSGIFQGLDGIEINDDERIIVVEPEYFEQLNTLLGNTPKRTLANYIMWRVIVYEFLPHGTLSLRNIFEEFVVAATGVEGTVKRDTVCAELVNAPFVGLGGMGFAISHEYIKKKFSDASKNEVNELVNNLRKSFKELVDESGWMNSETKDVAKEKADSMLQSLGYPDWIMETEELDAYYQKLGEISKRYLPANILRVKQFEVELSMAELRKKPQRNSWAIHPAVVNAIFSPNKNAITFPAGILQYPMFMSEIPRYLNYGAIGVVIGHEITHGFDDQGRQYDKDGNAIPWWSEDTIEAFKKEAQCYIEQYGNFSIPELEDYLGEDAHVNGILTQGENIADNGGLHESYKAYLKSVEELGKEPRLPRLEHYSPEQLFFISYAQVWCEVSTTNYLLSQVLGDPHSPGKFRVIGPVSNSPDFAKAFSCSPDTPMNNGDKQCHLW